MKKIMEAKIWIKPQKTTSKIMILYPISKSGLYVSSFKTRILILIAYTV